MPDERKNEVVTEAPFDRDPVEELAEDFLQRRREGAAVSISEYAERHPHLASRIRDLFPALLLVEELKPATAASLSTSAPPLAPRPGGAAVERLGDFRILREIGRGGMGVVYEAEQESLGRHVALKVLPGVSSPNRLRRFLREAQAAARLHHTNIVPVFGVGEQDGLRYYVMQLIGGRGLDQVLDALSRGEPAAPLPPPVDPRYWRMVAQIGVQVADALEYAHEQGTLHRDIKPANLLLDERGTAWVADFGLAKLAELDDLTHSGDTVGTLRYMAPERFTGKADQRSDVYSLGLVLYELLALRPAFDEKDRGRLIRQVTQAEPVRPRRLNPAVPRDLETIVMKAVASAPRQRYLSAGGLAADLRCFLEDRPVRARRATPLDRAWRWCRRNRALAALGGAALTLLVAVAVVASLGYFHTHQALERVSIERELADTARRQAEEERTQTRAQRERAEVNLRLATRAFEDIFSRIASDPLVQSPAQNDDEDEWPEPLWETVVTDRDAILLEGMLKFYDQFAEQNQADIKLQKETARAYRRVGEIQSRLGQYPKAETAYRRALATYQRLADAATGSPEDRLAMAAIHNELGTVFRNTGRLADAVAAHQQALDTLAQLAPPSAARPECRFELARSYRCLSLAAPWQGAFRGSPRGPRHGMRSSSTRGQESVENSRKALEILLQLAEEFPDNPRYRLAMARCKRDGYYLLGFGARRDEADQSRFEAVRILEGLIAQSPENPDYRYELAETYAMPWPRWRDGRSAEGRQQQLRSAIEIGTELVARYGAVPAYKASLARSHGRLAEVLRSGARLAEAQDHWLKAVELEKGLAAEFSSVDAYRYGLSRSLGRLAEIQSLRRQLPEARASLDEAIGHARRFQESAPEFRPTRMMLAFHYGALANVLRELGESALADEAARQAGELGHRYWHAGPPLFLHTHAGKKRDSTE